MLAADPLECQNSFSSLERHRIKPNRPVLANIIEGGEREREMGREGGRGGGDWEGGGEGVVMREGEG